MAEAENVLEVSLRGVKRREGSRRGGVGVSGNSDGGSSHFMVLQSSVYVAGGGGGPWLPTPGDLFVNEISLLY